MKENLANIYEYHHTHRRPAKFSIFEKERAEVIEQLVGERTGLEILDIGCRDGNLTRYFHPDKNHVLGIDIDRLAMAEAEKLGIKTSFEDLNGERDFLGDKKFDIVWAFEIVEHLYYPDVVVEKVHKSLKPHGVFVGSVPNGFSLPNRVRLFMGKKRGTSLMDPTHINHFTYDELYKTLAKHFRKVTIYGLVAPKWMPLAKWCPSLFSFMFARKCEK